MDILTYLLVVTPLRSCFQAASNPSRMLSLRILGAESLGYLRNGCYQDVIIITIEVAIGGKKAER